MPGDPGGRANARAAAASRSRRQVRTRICGRATSHLIHRTGLRAQTRWQRWPKQPRLSRAKSPGRTTSHLIHRTGLRARPWVGTRSLFLVSGAVVPKPATPATPTTCSLFLVSGAVVPKPATPATKWPYLKCHDSLPAIASKTPSLATAAVI